MERPPAIAPDTADWTFVVREGCPQCGFAPQDVVTTGDRLRATVPRWREALSRPDAAERPGPSVWSPLEYACHVRDTCRVFRDRLQLTLGEDDPTFENWDQDATADGEEYFRQVPATVVEQLATEIAATASAFDAVGRDQWDRPSRRSNGSPFTVRTLAVYFLHDVEHHVHDVAR